MNDEFGQRERGREAGRVIARARHATVMLSERSHEVDYDEDDELNELNELQYAAPIMAGHSTER